MTPDKSILEMYAVFAIISIPLGAALMAVLYCYYVGRYKRKRFKEALLLRTRRNKRFWKRELIEKK